MTLSVVLGLYVAFGVLFGLATHAHRHLFSEGHTQRQGKDPADPMQTRLAWTLICSALWPLMALTGLYSWWALRGR